MSSITLESTVGQLVAENPGRARIFEGLGIDFCCGGKRTLAEACKIKSLDANTVLTVLRAIDGQPTETREPDWTTVPMSQLCDHIESTHHAYMKAELPRLEGFLRKIAAKHGPDDPRLVQLLDVFLELRGEYEQHAMKEERILFPLIRRMEAGEVHAAASHCGSIENPIRVMIMEHDHAGNALERMHALTDGFTAPDDACNTYRATMHDLKHLQEDLHRHVHKENTILFPRACAAEAAACEKVAIV